MDFDRICEIFISPRESVLRRKFVLNIDLDALLILINLTTRRSTYDQAK